MRLYLIVALAVVALVSSFTTDPEIAQISVYPNPVFDELNIECNTSGALEIRSITGEIVIKEDVEKGSHFFNLDDVSAGVYLVKFQSEAGVVTSKFFKN